MSEYTDNHDIEKPEERSAPWTEAYHALADLVDITAEIRDQASALDRYKPKNGALFRATDTGEIWRGTGTEWVKVDIRVADLQAENAVFSEASVSGAPTDPSDVANKEYVDSGGTGGSGSVHGPEKHTEDVPSMADIQALTAADVGALSSSGGTANDLLVIDNEAYQRHLRFRREGTKSWDITPTINANGSLAIIDRESLMSFFLSSQGHIETTDNDKTVMTNIDGGGRFDVQETFPDSPEEGDVCIRTDTSVGYFFNGNQWTPFSGGDGGGGGGTTDPDPTPTDPTYYVDNFERSSVGSAYTTNDASIRNSSAFKGSRGLYIPSAQSFRSTSGLNNYPRAGGGPNNDGAHQFAFRFESFGGTSDVVRVHFAYGGSNFYTVEFNKGKCGFRHNYTDRLTWHDSAIDVGKWLVFRMWKWRTDGYIDCGLYDGDPDASGTREIRREQYTDTRSARPQSGGIGFYSNYTTTFSVDAWELLDL